MTNASVVLDVRDLAVAIVRDGQPVPILTRVAFELARGDILGLVGESGCGKSLTCRTIIGLPPVGARVMGGAIWWRGQDLLRLADRDLTKIRRRHIAMVFQDPLLYLNPVLTIETQMAEMISGTGVRSRCLDALAAAGLPDPTRVAKKFPHELSGGMRQRAMIAMALVRRPEILIADEITTALDVTTQMQVLDTLRMLQEQMGLSVLLVTHDMGVATRLCDRVAVMYAGAVVENAPAAVLFRHPLHPYTRALLEAHPRPGAERLIYIEGEVPGYLDPPSGCRFHPRCPHAMPVCRGDPPAHLPVEPGHSVACYLYSEEASG